MNGASHDSQIEELERRVRILVNVVKLNAHQFGTSSMTKEFYELCKTVSSEEMSDTPKFKQGGFGMVEAMPDKTSLP